jgi:hypothetical protein
MKHLSLYLCHLAGDDFLFPVLPNKWSGRSGLADNQANKAKYYSLKLQ